MILEYKDDKSVNEKLSIINQRLKILTDIMLEFMRTKEPEKFKGVMGNHENKSNS